MKVENGEKSIKTTVLWKGALVVSAVLVFLFAILGEAAPMGEAGPQVATSPLKVTAPPLKVTTRSLSDFLDAQRTASHRFFSPVTDYVGWTDSAVNPTIFALVDYAGLANDFLGGELGTQVNGSVIESDLADGSARITVTLFTTNALGFAQLVTDLTFHDSQVFFDNAPTIFGNKAKDVANGAEAAVGESTLFITFLTPRPEAPLPDLVDVLVKKTDQFPTLDLSFIATIPGPCENGTRAVLHVDQEGPPGGGGTEIVEILSEPCT